ncbi:alpha-hydroxy-acid oxidizing protein [Paenibacillus xerothermodurans]|uniref:L-lactate oxidase n=2 Tax=Paenibacillus xerothermodurans TaxID=1977292 RepID=A0A2W1NEU0_PAEXE|nr:alpha-hydroxy-acid oxidizing protein [Paenibacillus xerothermodurans]PZE22180.1 alpha-hydroxy-acid oxidizing protein [Paenibacillus xerothermodurans]
MNYYEKSDLAIRHLPVAFHEWEEKARHILAAGPFGYVHGGAGAGDTMLANRKAFDKYRIRPRICCDISTRDLTIEIFGRKFPVPFLLAPIGVNSILHPEGEIIPAKVCADAGVPYVLSNVSSRSMEEVADVMKDAVRWFQLYPPKDLELTRSFLDRAKKAGYSAIVVTVDSTMLGWRETDLRNAYLPFLEGHGMGNYFSDPVFRSKLEQPPEKDKKTAVLKALSEGNNTCFTWEHFAEIRKLTDLPLLLKGMTHPHDARLAIEHGANGIIVSNHGGRQLDGAIATLEALPEIVDAVGGDVPIVMDSGIRRGADILKALALGATAVLVGRPYAYALAAAGHIGVKSVIENLVAETEFQLAISGRSSLQQIDSSLLTEIEV